MKSTSIKPGVKAITKITGRDHIVTVIAQSVGSNRPWIVRTPAGNNIYRSARQLRELAPKATTEDGIDAVEDRAHARAMRATCSGCGVATVGGR